MRTHNDNLWRHSRNVNKKKRFSNIDYSLYHIDQEIGVSKIVSKSSVLRIMWSSGRLGLKKMQKLYDQVKELEKKYKTKKVPFVFYSVLIKLRWPRRKVFQYDKRLRVVRSSVNFPSQFPFFNVDIYRWTSLGQLIILLSVLC